MTTPASWREAYRAQVEICTLLKIEVDEYLAKAPQGWFTASRVKDEDSFYQKIETGRVRHLDALEDFFGALVVVPLQTEVSDALRFVERFFVLDHRRPPKDDEATHEAAVFRFNDIRLYGRLRVDDSLPPTPLTTVLFEIQIRTFFQHAWSSATHDLVYKHPRFSWSRSRVAAQIKAMIEGAELAMDSIDLLEGSPMLPARGSPESELNSLLDVVTANWDPAYLPSNLKRLTENLASLCSGVGLSTADLSTLLDRATSELGGHPEGWTPYQCVVDYMSRYQPNNLRRALCKRGGRLEHIFVTEEVLDRLQLSEDEAPKAFL